MKKFLKRILNLFFPRKLKCIFCGDDVPNFENDPICKNCKHAEIFNDSKQRCKICDESITGKNEYCDNCKSHTRYFDKATCPFIYTGQVKRAILKFKSDNAKYLAYPMANLIAKRLKSENMLDFDIIIPVPLSKDSFKKRGYNQAELLANELSKILQKPILTNIVTKEKETTHQKELGYSDRQKNLKGAFKLKNTKEIKDKNILIVDDILTTGATVSTISKLMYKHANKIYIATFARNIAKSKK